MLAPGNLRPARRLAYPTARAPQRAPAPPPMYSTTLSPTPLSAHRDSAHSGGIGGGGGGGGGLVGNIG